MSDRTQAETRQRVLDWEAIIRADSAMYSRLTLAVAEDPFLLEILQGTRQGQLEMNMLLAAVQYLLIGDRHHPLAAWYPSLGGTQTEGDLEAAFSAYVREHRDSVAELIATRMVQTNEVGRCAFLLPAYNVVTEMTGQPVALIEVGSSAGLTQNVDRYGYRYESTDGAIHVAPNSSLHLSSVMRGQIPSVATTIPAVEWRTGVDLNPVDVTDEDQARWLRALLWADRVDRHERLAAAIEVAQVHPPTVTGGDAIEAIPDLVRAAPVDTAIVIQHSFVLNQFSEHDRKRFYTLLDDLGSHRPIYRVGAEMLRKDRGTVLDLTLHGSARETIELADVHHHGTWIEWHRA